MTKTVLKFGSISGAIVAFMLIAMALIGMEKVMFGPWGMVIGFGSMLIAFAFIFVGIKHYRDKVSNGRITFAKALQVGLLIAFIASTFYVVTWLVEYYVFIPDFFEKYAAASLENAKASGKSPAEIAEVISELDKSREIYETPIGVVLFTYFEILPLGIIVSIIAALVMMRKSLKS
ncbi:DUF4199 domain-containing protein [Flavobacterium sp.]|uniref:DUF4199 domain-containing protein n=1 Tax=Flavobacterium sp. TaxID=239 RepID=UPI0025B92F6A|nr:DUF4199 domain-containing protein [Flavobacterium sp.]